MKWYQCDDCWANSILQDSVHGHSDIHELLPLGKSIRTRVYTGITRISTYTTPTFVERLNGPCSREKCPWISWKEWGAG